MIQICNLIFTLKQRRDFGIHIIDICAVSFFIFFCLCTSICRIFFGAIVNCYCTIALFCFSNFGNNSVFVCMTVDFCIIIGESAVISCNILFNCKRNIFESYSFKRLSAVRSFIYIYFDETNFVIICGFSFKSKRTSVAVKALCTFFCTWSGNN